MGSRNSPLFIAGDWGSTRLRVYLCRGERAIDQRSGPGVFAAAGGHERVLLSLIAPWTEAHGPLPIMLCGMIGSRNGWVEAPYAPCPARPRDLYEGLVRLEAGGATVLILPGVCDRDAGGAPEAMRGEETQVFGALALEPALAQGRWRLALPGTHTKWVTVVDGRIVGLRTALTGELFALLRSQGSLAAIEGGGSADGDDGFRLGLERQADRSAPGLLHQVFETRSRQLLDGWSPAFALDFLSGLLIGADVRDGLGAMAHAGPEIVLIGEPALTGRYRQALARFGAPSRSLSGEDCALAGLRLIAFSERAGHALH